MRGPLTQTILARIATSYLSNRLGTEIKIEKLEITGFKSVQLRNLLVMDQQNDTLAYTGYFAASYSGRYSEIDIKQLSKLTLRDADVRLKKIKDSDESNLQFLLDFFSSGKKKKQVEEEKERPVTDLAVRLDQIEVTNSRFRFENPNREKKEVCVYFSDISIQ